MSCHKILWNLFWDGWTHCGLVTLYGIGEKILVNTGSSNGLLPDGTKPLLKPMLTYHQWGCVVFTWGQCHRKCSRYLSLAWVWKLKIKNCSHISQGPMNVPVIFAWLLKFHRTCHQCCWTEANFRVFVRYIWRNDPFTYNDYNFNPSTDKKSHAK